MNGWLKKGRVMRRYDLTAEMYDMRYAEEQAAKIRAGLKHVKIEKDERVLDVGCGTGILFNYFLDKRNLIVGLDISKKTLLQAKQHIREKKIVNVHLVQADADNMPFGGNAFSKVFAITVLQNSPDPTKTLTEIKRVGIGNAVFVVSGLKSIFRKPAFIRMLRTTHLKTVAFEENDLKCYVAVCTDADADKQPYYGEAEW